MTRDRIAGALRRVHSSELANTTVEVFEPAVEYVQGDGWDVSYPDQPAAEYEVRVDSPEASGDRERSGTSSEIDAVVIVRDDTGQQWAGFGDEAEAPTRVEDTADGTRYEVETVVDQHNGMLELEVSEL